MDISWMPKKMQKKFEGKGLGDIVKDSIDTVSAGKIKQCGACKKRQERMNKWMQCENNTPAEEQPKKKPCTSCKQKMVEDRLSDLEGKVERMVGVLERISDKLEK